MNNKQNVPNFIISTLFTYLVAAIAARVSQVALTIVLHSQNFDTCKAQEPNSASTYWSRPQTDRSLRPQVVTIGLKMAPTQVTSSNKTVVAKMFWMLRPAPIIKSQDIRLQPHNALFIKRIYVFHLIRKNKWFEYPLIFNCGQSLLYQ